ncbi:MAG TPA: cytochrome c [Burkholderiales bacterium]|nr:cytochrome c [Burkholderiales bacterium]
MTVCVPPLWGAPDNDADDLESVVRRAQAHRRMVDAGRLVRELDCARCHGTDYRGGAGPSLIDSARSRSRADFVRMFLDGDPEHGMPPYRSIPGAAQNADGIYDYFRAVAEGSTSPGVSPPAH